MPFLRPVLKIRRTPVRSFSEKAIAMSFVSHCFALTMAEPQSRQLHHEEEAIKKVIASSRRKENLKIEEKRLLLENARTAYLNDRFSAQNSSRDYYYYVYS